MYSREAQVPTTRLVCGWSEDTSLHVVMSGYGTFAFILCLCPWRVIFLGNLLLVKVSPGTLLCHFLEVYQGDYRVPHVYL